MNDLYDFPAEPQTANLHAVSWSVMGGGESPHKNIAVGSDHLLTAASHLDIALLDCVGDELAPLARTFWISSSMVSAKASAIAFSETKDLFYWLQYYTFGGKLELKG